MQMSKSPIISGYELRVTLSYMALSANQIGRV
jgi:hypothetical protein